MTCPVCPYVSSQHSSPTLNLQVYVSTSGTVNTPLDPNQDLCSGLLHDRASLKKITSQYSSY